MKAKSTASMEKQKHKMFVSMMAYDIFQQRLFSDASFGEFFDWVEKARMSPKTMLEVRAKALKSYGCKF